MVTPASMVWLFALVEVLMAIAIGVLVGLVSSLVFHLRWNIKAAATDAVLAILGFFAVGQIGFVIGQLRQNYWPPSEDWFFGVAAAGVVLKQLVRLIQRHRHGQPAAHSHPRQAR